MQPYVRRVPSLKALKEEGTDEHFFQGQDYVPLPSVMAQTIIEWCKGSGVGNTSLPSKGAARDEAQEVYYIPLATREGRGELKAMTKALTPVLAGAVQNIASTVTQKNCLSSRANEAFDDLASIAAFRDTLMRLGAEPWKSVGDDPALIIGV